MLLFLHSKQCNLHTGSFSTSSTGRLTPPSIRPLHTCKVRIRIYTGVHTGDGVETAELDQGGMKWQERNRFGERCGLKSERGKRKDTVYGMSQLEDSGNVEVAIRQLLRSIDNRSCADCKANLVHEKDIYASLGNSVWLCEECSVCHTLTLGRSIALVKKAIATRIEDKWTENEIQIMMRAESNVKMNSIYERYLEHSVLKLSPSATSEDRKVWIRAKYDSKLFLLPIPPISIPNALGNDELNKKRRSIIIGELLLQQGTHQPVSLPKEPSRVLPSRLVDYFIVFGPGKLLPPSKSTSYDFENPKLLPSMVKLQPSIVSCFPDAKTYPETPIPEAMSPFVFPTGLCLSEVEKPPSYFSFILTNISRQKLYCVTLHIYELVPGPESLRKLLGLSQDAVLPNWKIVYAPKALTIISNYAFYHLYTEFLRQLYHISLSRSPLPLERYISNFMLEVPLPPVGNTEVSYGLPQCTLKISRPPLNKLPMVDFSYRPLFTCLSVDNILLIFKYLCLERQVCIMSSNIALLTPIQEALLSFLFPLVWQGCYIPIVPTAMIEVLDAPIPFLVGIHRRYLANIPSNRRPEGVLFVDVEENKVLLNNEVINISNDDTNVIIPVKPYEKLKSRVEEFSKIGKYYQKRLTEAGIAYVNAEHLIPISSSTFEENVKGNLVSKDSMRRDNTTPLSKILGGASSSNLEKSLQKATTKSPIDIRQRISILDPINNEPLDLSNILDQSCEEYREYIDGLRDDTFDASEIRSAFLRFFVFNFIDYQDYLTTRVDDGGSNGSSSSSVPREPAGSKSVLSKWSKSIAQRMNQDENAIVIEKVGPVRFDYSRYEMEKEANEYLKLMVNSQMFNNYMQERAEALLPSEILLFDEHILAKRNRSVITSFAFTKSELPFLKDTRNDIHSSFFAISPNNRGLALSKYSYANGFPVLDSTLYGDVRPVKILVQTSEVVARMCATIDSVSRTYLIEAGSDRSSHKGPDTDRIGEFHMSIFMETKVRNEKLIRIITKIQSKYRMRRTRRAYNSEKRRVICTENKEKYSIILQSFARMTMCKLLRVRAIRLVKVLQSLYRMALTRRKYLRIIHGITKVKARVKARQIRKKHQEYIDQTYVAYQEQLLTLWNTEHTSLVYRTFFWIRICDPSMKSLVRIKFMELELSRLCTSLGLISHDNAKRNFAGINTQAMSLSGPAVAITTMNKKALVTFRNTIYLLLKNNSSATANEDMFRRFDLHALKKRKQNLSLVLWTQNSVAVATEHAEVTKRICLMSSDPLIHQDILRVDNLWSEMIRKDVYSVAAAWFRSTVCK